MGKLPAIARALLRPKAYPHQTQEIELVQTQMSFVFLTGDYVYKVKKPVDLGFLDYTTLEKRHFFCHQELQLNRRLCPDAYLEVVPIVQDGGEVRLGGKGKVMEYAVKMRQLPRERMMDSLLPSGELTEEMVVKVAEKLAAFHNKAKTSREISIYGGLKTIRKNADENFSQTEKYIGISIPPRKYHQIKAYTDDFIKANISLFNKRMEEGRIRDCHGDLHAAHICFTNSICIYDCIEFNDRFRYCDVASEIAFLAMDLDRYLRPDLSHAFVNAYAQLSRDEELLKLLNFYKCYRAYVRGKVESFKLDDPYIPQDKAILNTAANYFGLAYMYTRAKPILFITAGLAGTGKTTLVQALSRRLGLTVISSDVTRKKLARIPITERRFESFEAGIYSEDFSRKTYYEMFTEAGRLLSQGQPVILDASFKKKEGRQRARKLAEESGADFAVIECILDEETVRKRLEQRAKEGSVSDGRWEIFESQKRDFDKITEIPTQKHIVLDTSQPLDENINLILDEV